MMHSQRNQISQFFRLTKMKVALVLLAFLACGLALPKYTGKDQQHNVKQQHVYDLLKYINNPIYNKEFQQIAQNFNLENNANHFKNEAYENFMDYYEHDVSLKKGEIFSIFNHEHMLQAKALFKLFYYADSYQTFYQTAVWARHHLNEGLFLYSYCVAIAYRPDTQNLMIPPIYELFPHHFYSSEVIQKAYKYKMTHQGHGKQEYTIHANYSGYYLNLQPEQSLSYYLEDVGLNAYYFYYHIFYPYWMSSEEFHLYHNRGELFYFVHKQLYARYHLERLSHGLGDVEYFNWDIPFKTGYYPSLAYPNGLAFPERPPFANLKEYIHHYGQRICKNNQYSLDYTYVQTYEQRIREAIDSGFVYDHEGNAHQLYSQEGINTLGNIIEGNADSIHSQFYGSFVNIARHLLGYSKHPLNHHKLAPSALEHLSTSLRDPAFYQIFKKVFTLIDQYKQNLPHYHKKHLHHQGLEIHNVEFEKLVTYYDNFFADITNGLYVTPEEYQSNSFKVKVHQYRLNHENFNYKVHVKSDKATKAAVRVYIGPKHDEHGRALKLSEIHDKVFMIDFFAHDLTAGENIITRNSADTYWFIKDMPSFFERYHKDVAFGKTLQHGIPLRFKLPRGTEEGLSFQVYVIVYPYDQNKNSNQHQMDGLHVTNYVPEDSFPWGYPFDRPVEHEDVYHVPNAYVQDVKIYHKVNKEILNHYGDSAEHVHDDDVIVYQHGDHNNYKKYHYRVGPHDKQVEDGGYHGKSDYQTYGVKGFLQDVMKNYPGLYSQHSAEGYKNYHDVQEQTPGDEKNQYKKKNAYEEELTYGKQQEHELYGDKTYHGQYQKHGYVKYPVPRSSEDYDYETYAQHPLQYGFGNEQAYNKYQNGYKYGKVYGNKYTPYQEDQAKYGYDNKVQYHHDSEDDHHY